jgi:hypothetical protein
VESSDEGTCITTMNFYERGHASTRVSV